MLDCIEPYLEARVLLKDGRGEFHVQITPDHMTEEHKYQFEIDQSYLSGLIRELENVLQRFPLRGEM